MRLLGLVITLILISSLVVGVDYFSYTDLGDETQSNGKVKFTGQLSELDISGKHLDNITVELIMRVEDSSGSRDLSPRIVKQNFSNLIIDQTSLVADVGPFDVVPVRFANPEVVSYYQGFVPNLNRINFLSIYSMIDHSPDPLMRTKKTYVTLWDNNGGVPGNRIINFTLDGTNGYIKLGDYEIGKNILTPLGGEVSITAYETYYIMINYYFSEPAGPFGIGVVGNSSYDNFDFYSKRVIQGVPDPDYMLIGVDLAFETAVLKPYEDFEYLWTPSLTENSTVYYSFRTTADSEDGGITLQSGQNNFEVKIYGDTVINETGNETDTNNTDTNMTGNNTNITDLNQTGQCPVCSDCSDWSGCVDDKQVRLCEKCESFQCVQYEEEALCKEDATWLDAFNAIETAKQVISSLTGVVDVSDAQELLDEAEDDYEVGEYVDAFNKAEQARSLALRADPEYEEKKEREEDITWAIGAGFLIFVLFIAYTQRDKLLGNLSARVPGVKAVAEYQPTKNLYKCDYCSGYYPYRRVRSYQGGNICTDCAKERDLI